ncbi:MAG: hypothetical protein COX48_02480 [bacterium (Candidatus Stahlbacteria) CG23_combo_of_CG06-09_8_20_14_all_34_7]|nr:MAG: hypothetical protein COX48_02480 [bacterium (Candidatus Stahlbacteria) CG23_combo_of_CG06-09_8_20_14_all_34_7]
MDNIRWVSHPAKDSKPVIKIIAVLGFLLMLLVGFIELSWVGLIIALLISVIVFLQFVFPTTFTLKEKTILIEFLFTKKEYELSRFKSFYPDNAGVILSPFIKPSRLENFRGIYVRYGKKEKENILESIKERLKT